MDKLLSYFGLVRISRAKQVQAETVKAFARAMAKYALDDFGVTPSITGEADAVKWSNEKFEMILNTWKPGVEIVSRWELKADGLE